MDLPKVVSEWGVPKKAADEVSLQIKSRGADGGRWAAIGIYHGGLGTKRVGERLVPVHDEAKIALTEARPFGTIDTSCRRELAD